MSKHPEISPRARDLFNFMPDISWMTTANLAKAIKIRKARISLLLDELEEARLIDIFFHTNGERHNPKREIVKVKGRKPPTYTPLLNALYIGFPIEALDRNTTIEIYLKSKLPIVPFEPLGKRPVRNLNSWQNLTVAAQLDYFFNNPSLNVGLRLPNNICVIDMDSKYQTWSGLPAFQKTLTVSTTRGFHHYFGSDAVVNITTSGVLLNTDTRCNGSYVVIPPSIHKSGAAYEWTNVARLQRLPIEFRREWRKANFISNSAKSTFRLPSIIPQGTRNDTLWRYGRSLRAQGYSYYEIQMELHSANAEHGFPSLPHGELNKLINHVWHYRNRS